MISSVWCKSLLKYYVSYSFSVARQYLVSWNSRTKNKETPSSLWRGRFFDARKASLRYEETPFSNWEGRLFICSFMTRANEVQPRYTELYSTEQLSSPSFQTELIIILNYELWIMNFELDKGVCFCGFPCSVRNSVSPSGFVPSVYSVLKMPQQRTYWRFSTTELIIILNYELWILNYKRGSFNCKPITINKAGGTLYSRYGR